MPGDVGDERVLRALAVAHLLSENKCRNTSEDKKKKDIANLLGVAPGTVTKALKKAKRQGWLLPGERFAFDKFDAEQLEAIERRSHGSTYYLLDRLNRLFQSDARCAPLREIYVSRSYTDYSKVGAEDGDENGWQPQRHQWDERARLFGRAAALHVSRLLAGAQVIGLAWGRLLSAVANGLEAIVDADDQAREFVPLSGDPLGGADDVVSASELASRFNDIFNAGRGPRWSLRSVPALIPKDMVDAGSDVPIRALWNDSQAYRGIFGSPAGMENGGDQPPAVERLDTILTSVSLERTPWGSQEDELIRSGGIRRGRLLEVAQADIGGVLLPRDQLSAPARGELAAFLRCWTGVTMADLERCARASEESDGSRPGVVLLAYGRDKVPAIWEALRVGVVNVLIIDDDAAHKLQDWLGENWTP